MPMVALFAHCITAQAGSGVLDGRIVLFLCSIMFTGCVNERGRGNPRQRPGISYADREHGYSRTGFFSQNVVPAERAAFHNLSILH